MKIRKLCSNVVLLLALWAIGSTAFAQIGYEYSIDLRKDVASPGKVFVDVFVEDIAGAPNGDSLGNSNFVFTIKDTATINFNSGAITVKGPYDIATNPGGYLGMQLGKVPHAEGAIINVQVRALTSAGAIGNWAPIGPSRTLVATIAFDLKTCPAVPLDSTVINIRRPNDAAPKGSITKAKSGLPVVVLTSNFGFLAPTQSLVYSPTITAVAPNDTICAGDSITFTSDIASRWWVRGTGNIDGSSYISTAGFRFTMADTFTVYAYNDDPELSGCYDSVIVVVNPLPVISAPLANDDFCDGSNINFTSNITGDWFDLDNGNAQIGTGTSSFSFTLNRVNGVNGGAKESRRIRLTSASGCDDTVTININYVPSLAALADTACSGANLTLTESNGVSISFWDVTNSTQIATGVNTTAFVLPAYSVPTKVFVRAVTDTITEGGCYIEDSIVVMPVPDNTLTVSNADDDSTICATQSFDVKVGGGIAPDTSNAQMTYEVYVYRQNHGAPLLVGAATPGNGAVLSITIPPSTLNASGVVDSTYLIKVFAYNTAFPACGDTLLDTTSITVKPVPGAVTAADANRCGSGSVTLTSDFSANWYSVDGVTLLSSNTQVYNTGVLADAAASYQDSFAVARTNGQCDGPLDTVIVTINPSLKVSVAVFLDGPYNGTDMNTTLTSNATILATMNAAYCDSSTLGDPTGFLPATVVMDTTLGYAPIPNTAVDVIEVQLRDASDILVDVSYAWLMNDGSVLDFSTASTSYVQFCAAPDASYRVVIKHRNHISIQSATAANAYDRTVPALLDLTAPANVYEGADIVNTMMRNGGVIRMAAGNAYPSVGGFDQGECNASDFYTVSVENDALPTDVYSNADINMDGDVSAADFTLVDTNSLNLYYASFPNP